MADKKQLLSIEKHEAKTSKAGKDYCKFKTNDGWYSCFEEDIINQLKQVEGTDSLAEVTTAEANGFKNIRQFHAIKAQAQASQAQAQSQAETTPPLNIPAERLAEPSPAQEVIHKTAKPNSYEIGKVGNRFKLYFDSIADLKAQMQELEEAGFLNEPEPSQA